MALHSDNPRLALLSALEAHVFWGYRSFIDFCVAQGVEDSAELGAVVIADKGFIDRRKTVFSVNMAWGRLGRFVVNPEPEPIEIAELRTGIPRGVILELGQDEGDFSYKADARDGRVYHQWLANWPERRFRPHPKVERPSRSLEADLAEAGLVVGLNTSALVTASLAGVQVEAFGPHSMASGIAACREERLRWLRSIEWDRRDQTAAEAIAACVARPELASEAPEASILVHTARKASQKKGASAQKSKRARGKRAGRSGAGTGESA